MLSYVSFFGDVLKFSAKLTYDNGDYGLNCIAKNQPYAAAVTYGSFGCDIRLFFIMCSSCLKEMSMETSRLPFCFCRRLESLIDVIPIPKSPYFYR